VTPRALLPLLVLPLAVAGCGSGAAAPTIGSLPKAHEYQLANFKPTAPVAPGKPTTISFVIQQPNGQPLTEFRTGPGPHTGVHLIIVRDDLSAIIHTHPPIGPDGTISQRVTLPSPGPYHVLVDVYPKTADGSYLNFQLTNQIEARGDYKPQPLPAFRRTVVTDGYTFTMHGVPRLHVAQAGLLTISVKDPQGKPVTFEPWYGALAHAIFFHEHNLTYFHTHVCAPGANACSASVGGAVSGSSATPGVLHVGVLLPERGRWRMFVQIQDNGRRITAPFTLVVQ